MPLRVNSQITDAVTTHNTTVLAHAAAMALGNLYQATGQALANAAHNATAAQMNAHTVLQATTTQGIALLYGIDAAVVGSPRPAAKSSHPRARKQAKKATKKRSRGKA